MAIISVGFLEGRIRNISNSDSAYRSVELRPSVVERVQHENVDGSSILVVITGTISCQKNIIIRT